MSVRGASGSGRILGYQPPPGSNERTKLLRLKVTKAINGHSA